MPEVRWIKIVTDMFDNRKIRQIETMPDADSILVIWLKLLCLAGKVNECGAIMFTADIPYTDEMLAKEFDRPMNTVRLALTTFERFGMIELSNSVYSVANWEKYQNIDGMEKIREQARLRNLAYRERKRLVAPPEASVSVTSRVTSHDGTEIDKEIEIELEKEGDAFIPPTPQGGKRAKPATAPFTKPVAIEIIRAWTSSPALEKTLTDFYDSRRALKKPMTENALNLMLKKLEQLAKTEKEQIEILEESIRNGYQGIFAIKKQSGYGGSKPVETDTHSKNYDGGWGT